MNRVLIRIEADHEGIGERMSSKHVTETAREFPTPHYTLPDVLAAMEDALRGAGFHCPAGALMVERDVR